MPNKKTRINVGLIGCNRRALWYGAIFDKIDPNAYADLAPSEYHHMTYYNLTELRIPQAKGFRLAKVYDPEPDAAATVGAAFRTKPEVCKRLEDVCDGVDLVFIANESGDGKANLKYASAALGKGVPTFVDRPFAATVKDAKAMIALARRKRTPLLSCSHMRMLPGAAHFRNRFAELDPVESGMVQGHGPNPAHMADGVELAVFLFGEEFRGRAECVQSMGDWPLEIMHVKFSKRFRKAERVLQTAVINSHTSATRYAFWAKASSLKTPVDSPDLDAFAQPAGGLAVMNALKEMVQTGRSPLSPAEMVEPVAVMQAGRRSHNKARPVPLKRLR